MKCSLGNSDFLEEISRLSHSTVFLYFFALIIEEGFLTFLAILWNTAFRWVCLSFSPLPSTFLLFSGICKASSDKHSAFSHFFSWEWSWSLPPVLCHQQNEELIVAVIVFYVVIICSMSHWSLYQEFNKHLFAKWMTDGWFSLLVWKSAATGIVAFSV